MNRRAIGNEKGGKALEHLRLATEHMCERVDTPGHVERERKSEQCTDVEGIVVRLAPQHVRHDGRQNEADQQNQRQVVSGL